MAGVSLNGFYMYVNIATYNNDWLDYINDSKKSNQFPKISKYESFVINKIQTNQGFD